MKGFSLRVFFLSIVSSDLLHPGAGTMSPEIISSEMRLGSPGGGGHTNLSMMSSVALSRPASSGGSVRDDLQTKRLISSRKFWIPSLRTMQVYIYRCSFSAWFFSVPRKRRFCDVSESFPERRLYRRNFPQGKFA